MMPIPSGQPQQIHLAWGDDPATSISVIWLTDLANNPALVEYRAAGATDWSRAKGISYPSPGQGTLHRVDLSALSPDTEYEYRVSADAGVVPEMSEPASTRTAVADAGDFSFVYFCDTGLIGRPDGLTTGTKRIIGDIVEDAPLFLLGGGDYAYGNADGRYESMTDAADEWFRQWSDALTRFPMMPQYGNHEIFLTERYEEWAPRFAYPKEFDEGRSYSFDVANTHFTALFMPESITMPDAEELEWLDADLASARACGVDWLIVFQHAPIYGHGTSHPATPEMRALVTPIYERHSVDIVLTGHDQSYERTLPMVHVDEKPVPTTSILDNYKRGDGVIYAKISPAGKKSEIPKDFSKFTTDFQSFMAVRDDAAHHYALLTVHGGDSLEYTAFAVPEDRSAKMVLDHFFIKA